MEDNVALDSSKQKKFVKSIKKLIKKSGKKPHAKKEIEVTEVKTVVKDNNAKKIKKRRRPERGLVYLSHIPHGFYEHQMTQYFKQFGVVTNVRVIRSKRTGNSKGYAFVEFKEPAVAEIVAETMNNYLMGKRIIKAVLIPSEKQRPNAMRKHWSSVNNPSHNARMLNKKVYNQNKDEAGELKRAKKIIFNLNKTKKKLSDFGISYDFFTPVDVPESLTSLLAQNTDKLKNGTEKTESKVSIDNTKTKKKVKTVAEEKLESKFDKDNAKLKTKKTNEVLVDNQIKISKENSKVKKAEKQVPTNKTDGKNSKENAKFNKKQDEVAEEKVDKSKARKVKKDVQLKTQEVDKKVQKQKEQKLKDKGVKSVENYIKIQEDEDSDSSLDFDSDEFDKMLESDSDSVDDSSDGGKESDDDFSDEEEESVNEDEDGVEDEDSLVGVSSGDDSSVIDSGSDDEEIVPPPKKMKGKGPIIAQPPPTKKQEKQKKKPQLQESVVKRKIPQKNVESPKKPNFEKKAQQPMKKQFKKKK